MSEQAIEGLLNKKLTRRELLRRGVVGIGMLTFAALAARGGPPDWLWAEIIRRELAYPWEEGEEKILYGKEKLFVEENSRLSSEGLKKYQYAYVLTHVGYTEYMVTDFFRYIEQQGKRLTDPSVKEDYRLLRSMATKAYGDYLTYVTNVVSLVKYLNNIGALTIFALEERDFYHPDIPRPELRPFDGAMIVVTKNATYSLAEKVQTTDGQLIQQPDLMFSLLRKVGIQEARFAGEWSIVYAGFGCLGGTASEFYQNGFNIKGVRECIYPTIKPQEGDNEILRKLYTEAASLSSILGK